MKNDQGSINIEFTGPLLSLEIKKQPSMAFVFLKATLLSFFRSNTIAANASICQTCIVRKNYTPSKEMIEKYKTLCGFSENRSGIIPMPYIQTLFNGLLGRFITSSFFPVNPLGLIHIFQSFDQQRPLLIEETIDLFCTLSKVRKTPIGVETDFILEVRSGEELVWEGLSTFFSRNRIQKKKRKKIRDQRFLEPKESIHVPSGTGKKYASVSGDYNPHHLYNLTAKLFGFKSAIAHGMWSLARVVASLDKEFGMDGPAGVEADFKRPIFIPAETMLGYESQSREDDNHQGLVNFELRDEQKGLPHLKGQFRYTNQR